MKSSTLSRADHRRTTGGQESMRAPGGARRVVSSATHAPQGLAGGGPRLSNAGADIRPRSSNPLPMPPVASRSPVLGAMTARASRNPIALEADPKAWLNAKATEASAARRRLLDGAIPLLKLFHIASPLAAQPYQLDTYLTADGQAQNAILAPAKALIPGLLRSDKIIELSPGQLDRANALSTTHPGIATQMPDMQPRLHVISPAVAASMASAREVIDLVKALVPSGAGNQVKDLLATAGESHLRSRLSFKYHRGVADLAHSIIQFQGGDCDGHASLAFHLLAQNPAFKDYQIDIVEVSQNVAHVFAVIRGDRPEEDIVVDAWAPFASPTFVQDALPMHRTLLDAERGKIRVSKPAGTVAPAMDIEQALKRQSQWQSAIEKHSSLSEAFRLHAHHEPDAAITQVLIEKENLWDVPFSGNPNVRYEVRDPSGRALTDFPIRFDMQRAPVERESGSETPARTR